MIRCYQCKYYRGGKYRGKCVDKREGRKPVKVDAIDFCDYGEAKTVEG